jgi:hypothetical protein
VHLSQVLSEAKQIHPEKAATSRTPHLWLIVVTSIVLVILFGMLVWCLLCPNKRTLASDYIEADRTIDRTAQTLLDQSSPDRHGQPRDEHSKKILKLEDNQL